MEAVFCILVPSTPGYMVNWRCHKYLPGHVIGFGVRATGIVPTGPRVTTSLALRARLAVFARRIGRISGSSYELVCVISGLRRFLVPTLLISKNRTESLNSSLAGVLCSVPLKTANIKHSPNRNYTQMVTSLNRGTPKRYTKQPQKGFP